MKHVRVQSESAHLGLGDDEARLIASLIELGPDAQTGRRARCVLRRRDAAMLIAALSSRGFTAVSANTRLSLAARAVSSNGSNSGRLSS